MLLSDRIVGFSLVPEGEGGFWNYALLGHRFVREASYGLAVDLPRGFYDEVHRLTHSGDVLLEHGGEETEESLLLLRLPPWVPHPRVV
jgi:hypothetical protein